MFIIVPAKVETLMDRHPWSNWAIITLTTLSSFFLFSGFENESIINSLALSRTFNAGIIGHAFLHADIFHLAGNMVFLWVFGNAICANTTDRIYITLYFAVILGAAICHLLIDGNPAIGASGATNGIVGISLAIYPINRVHMAGLFFFRPFTFSARVWHLALVYFALDLFGVISNGIGIAYWAHIGGILTGLGLGLVGLKTRILGVTSYDNKTLLEFLGGSRSEIEEANETEDFSQAPIQKQPIYTFTPPTEESTIVHPTVPVPKRKE